MTVSDSASTPPPISEPGDFTSDLREDLLHHDPLLSCLIELTRLHGRPSTRAALSAGLPLEGGRLVPSLFARAATRAGLASRVVRRSLDAIDNALLPVVLLLKGDEDQLFLNTALSDQGEYVYEDEQYMIFSYETSTDPMDALLPAA